MKRPRSLSLFREIGRASAPTAFVTTDAAPEDEAPQTEAAPARRGVFGRLSRKPEPGPEPDGTAEEALSAPATGKTGAFARLLGRGKPKEPGLPPVSGPVDPSEVANALSVLAQAESDTLFAIDDQQRLVENGRKRFAIGLLWLPFVADRTIKEQASEASFGDDAPDLYALVGDRLQVGFGNKYSGLKHGMPVAATLFSPEVLPGNWLGVFALDGDMGPVWWLIAWRDGQVYDDRVLTDETDAQEAFSSLREAPNWTATICPSTWDVPDALAYDLGKVLAKRRRPAKLVSTNRLRTLIPVIAVVAVLLVGAIAGYVVWQNILEQRRLAEIAARPRPVPVPVVVVPPWVGKPRPQDFVDACIQQFQETLIFPTGWRIEPQQCTVDGENIAVETRWTREAGGRLAWFIATLRDRGFEDLGVSENLASGTVFSALPVGDNTLGDDITPLPAADIQQRLRLRYDTLGLDLNLRLVAPTAAPPSRIPGAAAPPPVWDYLEFTVSTSTPVDEYIRLVSDIPAAVPDRLTYDVYAQQWRLVLRFYSGAR